MSYQKLPPCDGDCLHCRRSAEHCRGGGAHNKLPKPYVDGTQPGLRGGSGKSYGAVKMTSGCGHLMLAGRRRAF